MGTNVKTVATAASALKELGVAIPEEYTGRDIAEQLVFELHEHLGGFSDELMQELTAAVA